MSWKKKIEKSVGGDLQPGEQVIEGIVVHQAGFAAGSVMKGIGGLVGAAIAHKYRPDGTLDSSFGAAATIPKESLVLGVTDRRVIVCGWSKMMGKPKGLLGSFPFDAIAGMDVEPKATMSPVVLAFQDGSGVTLEAPRIGNDAEAFVAAVNARCTAAP